VNVLREIWQMISWKLWGRRLAIRQVRKLLDAGPPKSRDNRDIYRMISYDDMHLEHYQRINESAPKEVLAPPKVIDDGLN